MKRESLIIRLMLHLWLLLLPIFVIRWHLDRFWLGELDGDIIVQEKVFTVSSIRLLWQGSLMQNLTSGR